MADQKPPLLQLKPVTIQQTEPQIGPKSLPSIPNILGALFIGISIIMGIRWTYPIVEVVLNLWDDTSKTGYIVSVLIYWMVYLFLMYMITINTFWKKPTQTT